VEIREVSPIEYEEAGRVTALAYREFADPADEDWQEYVGFISDVAGRADRTPVLVAVEGGRILGSATLELDRTLGDDDAELPPDTASLRMLGVDPDARGAGAGRALVEACIDRTRTAGKSVLVLRTTPEMEAARKLYASFGFVRDPDRDLAFESGFRLIAYRLDLERGGGSPR
jgi:ribosomal protein S18 acetylase RimI-like enzyme